MDLVIYIVIIIVAFAIVFWYASKGSGQGDNNSNDLNFKKLSDNINELPSRILNSITSSSNHHKGNLGELIGYISLSAKYDKLIPFHDITDFIGIRFPREGDNGSIDFIDIKNGKEAKLSKHQSKFKKLIEGKHIRFLKVNMDTSIVDVKDTTKED